MGCFSFSRLFRDSSSFDPSRDGQVPLRRDPFSLAARTVVMVLRMGVSRHPGDLLLWLRSMYCRRRPLSMVLPWLTFDAIRAIDDHLVFGDRLFEYGSGHSTLYWAQRGIFVVSMEDDPVWFELAGTKLATLPNATLHFAADKAGYVRGIDVVDDDFDVILVDGTFRMECIEAAVSRIRPGGLLVVDNTDWHWFSDIDQRVPNTWRKMVFDGCAPFIGYPSQTTIWKKPGPI